MEHRWKDANGTEWGADQQVGATVNGEPCDPQACDSWPEEMLRLAERVTDLGRRLKVAVQAQREGDESLGNASLYLGQQALRGDRLEQENALLRRERALLIELEKARTRILASIFETGGGCNSEDVRQVGELLMAVEALHLEASGGVQRPDSVPCACVLCRPEGALQREEDVSAGREVAGLIEQAIVEHLPEIRGRMPVAEAGICTACGEQREIFEGRCHDCISAGRYREGRL